MEKTIFTILIVDDEKHNRDLLEALLHTGHYLTRTAASGEEALAEVARELPDLILLDIMMPGMDGFEVARRLKADMRSKPVPIIIVTMLEDRESKLRGLDAGAEDFITKPVDRAELWARVRNLLRLKEYSDFLDDHNRILEMEVRERTAALRESEERYHQLFEHMGSGVAIYQPDAACEAFTFKSVNRALERIEQVRCEELLGRNVEEAFPGARAFGLLDAFRRVCRSGVPERLPAAFYRDSRISGWRENYVYRLESGEVVAVYDDVGERKAHEAQIINLNRTLRTLSACNVALVHARTEEELFQSVCRHIVETGEHLFATIFFPGAAPEGFPYPVSSFGNDAIRQRLAELQDDPEYARRRLTHAALQTRQTRVYNWVHDGAEYSLEKLAGLGIGSALSLPLLNNDHVYGALTVFSSTPEAFDAAEIKLMEELAGDIAYGIVTLRTRAERDRSAAELRRTLEQTITAIALTLEKRDPYAAGHQQRVASLAAAIAAEMGLPPQQVEGIRFGALLHNIGTVAVPAEILNRPSKLSDLQFALVKQHTQAGFEIVKDIPFPWPVAQMVLQHHERLDGSGYPQGLKDGQILLEARILAVADVLEAMLAYRPYRVALEKDAALATLTQARGTQFDTDAVDACLRVMQR